MAQPYRVQWEIDVDAESPRDAAMQVWTEVFERGEPGPDDACCFQVRDASGSSVEIDLSDDETAKVDPSHCSKDR